MRMEKNGCLQVVYHAEEVTDVYLKTNAYNW